MKAILELGRLQQPKLLKTSLKGTNNKHQTGNKIKRITMTMRMLKVKEVVTNTTFSN